MAGFRSHGIGIAAAAMAMLTMADSAGADVVVAINKSAQRMAVIVDGAAKHSWAVSTGLGGGPPSGSYRPQRLERSWYSRKYHRAPMPYSIFFYDNYAIHGTVHVRQLGRRASKGCVRLHPANAAILFDLVRSKGMATTRIVVSDADPVVAPPAGPAGSAGNMPNAAGRAERGDAPPQLKPSIGQAAVVPAAGDETPALTFESATADAYSARPRESGDPGQPSPDSEHSTSGFPLARE